MHVTNFTIYATARLACAHNCYHIVIMDTELAIADALQQNTATGGPGSGSDVLFGLSMGGLIAGLVFSGIGFIYFKYGKSTRSTSMMVCGVLLLVYPYFVNNTTYVILAGLGLTALPHLLDRFS